MASRKRIKCISILQFVGLNSVRKIHATFQQANLFLNPPKLIKQFFGRLYESFCRGIFTRPIQDDRMNMTEKVELDSDKH